MISLLFLKSSASASSQHGFSIKVFTSPDDQFWTNSVIVEGVREVMLVDAQLTKTSAKANKQINDLLDRAFVEGCEGPNQSPRDGCQ
jgi:hypothetical protein